MSTSDGVSYSSSAYVESIPQSIMSFTPEHLFSFSSPGNISSNELTSTRYFNLSNGSKTSGQISSSTNASNSRRKRGRPSINLENIALSVSHVQIVSDSDASDNYSPNHFWCPSCLNTYDALACPIHKCLTQPDTVVSYARLSLPAGLKLIQKRGRLCVILTKRLPALAKFGPVVAPLITGEELRQKPSCLPDCSFRVDMLGAAAQSEHAEYLRLNDESQCNWMMFVQRRSYCIKPIHRIPESNAVAYQQGADGVFFITTRYIRPGEELVVTYAPPYAKRCGLSLHDSTTFSQSEQSTKQPIPGNATSRAYAPPPDEIHCFRCAVTFNCEDAFRIHCLGHPDELLQRGFLQPPTASTIEPVTTKSDTHNRDSYLQQHTQPLRNLHSVYSNRLLYCSLCSFEVNGLDNLIQHTDLMHSVLKPSIFKASLPATISADSTLVQPEGNHMDDVDSIELSVGVDKTIQQSFLNSTGIPSLPFTGICESTSEGLGVDDDDILVVDLNHASQNLLERPLLWAYGCGVCSQRFPNLLALDQHKQHTCTYVRPSSCKSSDRLPIAIPLYPRSLTPPSTEQTKDMRTATSGCALLSTPLGESMPVPSVSLITQVREATMIDETQLSSQELTSGADSLKVQSSDVPVSVFSGPMDIYALQLDFECAICWTKFRTRSAYTVHMRAHDCSNPRTLQVVNHCRSSSPKIEKAAKSDPLPRRTRIKSKQYQKRGFFCCRVCNQRLDSQTAWRQHSLEHRRASDNRYPCPICSSKENLVKTQLDDSPRVYDTFDQLQRHMRHVHCNQIFPCPYCPSVFGRRQALLSHLSCHTGQRDFTCPQCGRSFARKDNLQRHRKTHGDTNV